MSDSVKVNIYIIYIYVDRFLKQTLSVCQNLCKYSHPESNTWIRALEFMQKFQTVKNSTGIAIKPSTNTTDNNVI